MADLRDASIGARVPDGCFCSIGCARFCRACPASGEMPGVCSSMLKVQSIHTSLEMKSTKHKTKSVVFVSEMTPVRPQTDLRSMASQPDSYLCCQAGTHFQPRLDRTPAQQRN